MKNSVFADYICHSGIKGMKWGVRRYQNEDGTLTDEGKERYYKTPEGTSYSIVTKKKTIDDLGTNSALTYEGMAIDSPSDFDHVKKVLNQYGVDTKNATFYYIKGKDMNKFYGLTKDNAYSDDFPFVSIDGLKFNEALVRFKMMSRGSWMDDLLFNNQETQKEINRGSK